MKPFRALLGGSLMPFILSAAPVTVMNPGFEDNSVGTPYNEFTFGPPAGWDLYDPGGITSGGDGPTFFTGTLTPQEPDPVGNPGVYSFFPDGAPEGSRVGILFNYDGSGGSGEYGLVQTLGDVLTANTAYTLRVLVGNIDSGTAVDDTFFNLEGFPGYRVDLLAGGVLLQQDFNSLAGTLPDGSWGESVVSFSTGDTHAQLGQPLGIRLVNLNQVDVAGADLEVDFDDIRLDAILVPEPGTLWLFVMAGMAVWISVRRSDLLG